MNKTRSISRRQFLIIMSGTVGATALAACQSPTPAPTAVQATSIPATAAPATAAVATIAPPTAVPATAVSQATATTAAVAAKYKEAPMLAQLVTAGSLPPVDQRLPDEPLVVKLAEGIGKYGGTARGANTQPDGYEGWLFNGFDGMTAIGTDGFTIIPDIATSWEIDEDKHIITLHLRKGAKWSDGQPYTADDIMFWFNDIVMDKDITPTPDPTISSAEKVDDFTVKLGYQDLNIGARLAVHWPMTYAKHYHSQFHPKYVDATKMAELVAKYKVAKPGDILASFKVPPGNLLVAGTGDPGLPMMGAYFLKARDAGKYTCERNPFYYKVDPDGNQLPYIDSTFWGLVQDAEALKLGVVAGDYDWEGLHSTLADYPLYSQNADKAGIAIKLWPGNFAGNICLQFNQIAPDKKKAALFSDVNFRRAMSLGLDRNEFNKVQFLNQGLIQQAIQLPGGDYYVESAAKAYLDYDATKANQMLDGLKLDKLGSDGFRLYPDGSPLAIVFEYADFSGMGSAAELVADMWRKAVHINIQTKKVDTNLLTEHRKADLLELSCMTTSRNSALQFAPFYSVAGIGELEYGFGYGWGVWHTTGGKQGVEPPDEMKKQQERWFTMQTANTADRIRLGKEINTSQGDNLWSIGTVGLTPVPVVVSAKFGNVPDKLGLYAPDAFFACPARTETWYFKS
jgi:peptide/nickel transport system substrate-binding protein